MTKYKLVGYTEEYYKASDVEKEIEDLKCCGNCIYYSDNVCLCNNMNVGGNEKPCGAWELLNE